MMQEGKDINEILKMPFMFVVDILEENNKPKEEQSIIKAFGG